MEVFVTPNPYKRITLIDELESAGFSDIRINKVEVRIIDAVVGDRTAIQAVLDVHDATADSNKDGAKRRLRNLDLSAPLTDLQSKNRLKDVIRVLRGAGLLRE